MVNLYRYGLTPLGEAFVWLRENYPKGFESCMDLDEAIKLHPDQLWLDLAVSDVETLQVNLVINFGFSPDYIS